MALEQRQDLRLAQQLIMTPQLQLAIKLLQMSQLELLEHVEMELEQNPVLEEISEIAEEGSSKEGGEEGLGTIPKISDDEELNEAWSRFWTENTYEPKDLAVPEEVPSWENFVSRKPSLAEHLSWQLRLSDFDGAQRKVGELIIGNLDENGYLQASNIELAEMSEVPLEVVEKSLKKIQEFDPPGVAARSLRECLLLQASNMNLNDSLVENIIRDHLERLENRDYKAIVRSMGVPLEKVIEAANIILAFEPKPGRAFSSEEVYYVVPDVFILKVGGEYVILLNEEGLPRLRISPYYKSLLQGGGNSSGKTREYVQDKLRAALWLVKSIQQRQRTIYRTVESIARFQREFLDKGIGFMKPLTLREVATDIAMHESTVSRVTTNKFAHTPQGIYELKFFFSSGVTSFDGEAVASESVKRRIRLIAQSENPCKPLSDQKITEILRGQNIVVARRTVAKYREMMGILPSNKRKKLH